jgi:hypothetical protein
MARICLWMVCIYNIRYFDTTNTSQVAKLSSEAAIRGLGKRMIGDFPNTIR